MRLARIASIAFACGAAAYALPPLSAAGQGLAMKMNRCSELKFGQKAAETQKARADDLAARLKLTDAQKAAYKDVQDMRAKAMTDARLAACNARPAGMAFEQRLEFLQGRMQARLDAMKAEAPKLVLFYNSLDSRQKGQFEDITFKKGGAAAEAKPGAKPDASAGADSPRSDEE